MATNKSTRGEKKNGKENGNCKAVQKSSSNKEETKNKLSHGSMKKKREVIEVPSSSTESEEEEEEERTEQRKKSRNDEGEDKEEEIKLYCFPINRINKMLRSEYSDLRINQDAIFLISKATENFLERFTEDAYAVCDRDRKKTIGYKHLTSVVSNQKRYDFLSDFVPQQLKAEDALAERKLTES